MPIQIHLPLCRWDKRIKQGLLGREEIKLSPQTLEQFFRQRCINTWDELPTNHCCCSVTKSCPTLCDPVDCSMLLWPHGLQHAQLLRPSVSPRACSNSCPLNQWCHPTILSSVAPFSFCPQSFLASASFSMSGLFTSGSQSIGVSASAPVLSMNIQSWFHWGLTGLISLQSKGLSRFFSNTAIWKHKLFGSPPSCPIKVTCVDAGPG